MIRSKHPHEILILGLIKEDLRTQRLVYLLNDFGLNGDECASELYQYIFMLLGINEEDEEIDEIFSTYHEISKKVRNYNVAELREDDSVAREIYCYLLSRIGF